MIKYKTIITTITIIAQIDKFVKNCFNFELVFKKAGSTNIKTAMRAANEIKFGETMINRENMEMFTAFHAGMRKSGIGGADGKHGMYEYMQTHGVYINYDD